MNRVILCGWLITLLLGGCSLAPSDGPSSGKEVIAQANEGDKIAFDVVKVDDAVVKVLQAQGEPAFHERFKKYTPPPDIKIAVGDTVSAVIWEAAATGLFGNSLAVESGRSGTRIPDQQVGPDGAISIPYAGRIAAAGRTTAEVERAIEKELGPKALEPHAIVVIRRSVANSVSVAGEALKAGRVPLSAGGDRLLQVITAASGGVAVPPHDLFVQLSRNGVTATVPLATLVEHSEENIFVEPGDVLTLVRRPKTFSVFGATGKNTAITFDSEKLSLAEALAKAGGLLDDRADPQSVFLFRYEPVGLVRALGQPIATAAPIGVSPIAYRLDLRDAKSYPLAQEFRVRDKDIIFVANSEGQVFSKIFATLSKVTGPVITGILTCQATNC
jgi:polysaccharide export outer membrane protein